jgi:hypothetical protein
MIISKSYLKLISSKWSSFWLTSYLWCLVDLFFSRQLVFLFYRPWNKGYHIYFVCSYLDLHLAIDSEARLRTKLYDKRDDFPIVNFTFTCSNIPAAPAYEVYNISQLIRYYRVYGSYHDFFDTGLLLTRKPLNQGFLVAKLNKSLRKYYGNHNVLVNRYGISVSKMTTYMFRWC